MPRTRRTRFALAVVAGAFGVVVGFAALLTPLVPASTAAVSVPPTSTGYVTVTATGATLAQLTMTISANGATFTGARLVLAGRHPQLLVDLRLGTGTPTRCAWRGAINDPPNASEYLCEGLTHTAGNTAIVVEVRRPATSPNSGH